MIKNWEFSPSKAENHHISFDRDDNHINRENNNSHQQPPPAPSSRNSLTEQFTHNSSQGRSSLNS